MENGKPYGALGDLMDEIARTKGNVRGPHRIARYVKRVTGEGVSGEAVAHYMYGDYSPRPEFLALFAKAFGLDEREKATLAYAYTFRFSSAA